MSNHLDNLRTSSTATHSNLNTITTSTIDAIAQYLSDFPDDDTLPVGSDMYDASKDTIDTVM
jgi:hypothetical protein